MALKTYFARGLEPDHVTEDELAHVDSMLPDVWAQKIMTGIQAPTFWSTFGPPIARVPMTRRQRFRAWRRGWRCRFRDCFLILRGTHYASDE